MFDFNPLYNTLLHKVLRKAFTSPYIGGYVGFDNEKEFTDKVEKLTGLKTLVTIEELNNNFPQLLKMSLRTNIVYGHNFFCEQLAGGSIEYPLHTVKSLSHIKAKGEFLERLSSALPLDVLVEDTRKKTNILRTFPKLLSARKLFSYGNEKIESRLVYFFLSKIHTEKQDELSQQPTSNGGAGHFDYDIAVLRGLLEVIERDAFLVYWLNSISPKKIDVDAYIANTNTADTHFSSLKELVHNFKKYNLEYYFLDITSDIAVPAVACILVADSPTGKRCFLGASSGFNPNSTLYSSATEATGLAASNYFKEPFVLHEPYVPFVDKKIGRGERLRLYMTESMFQKIEFFIGNDTSITVESWSTVSGVITQSGFSLFDIQKKPKNALSYLRKIFNERKKTNSKYEVLVYEIKNKLLSHFDYKVVRVFCDALYSLYLNEHYADPEHPRLKEFIRNKGLESVAKLNPWPHLFP